MNASPSSHLESRPKNGSGIRDSKSCHIQLVMPIKANITAIGITSFVVSEVPSSPFITIACSRMPKDGDTTKRTNARAIGAGHSPPQAESQRSCQ